MERHSANALAVARFLAGRSEVRRVHYPGLPDHPQHDLARKLLPAGCGGVLAFELRGGAAAVARFFGALPLLEFAPSFGDVTTTWTYPARTSHRPLSPDEQAKLGIDPGLVRLSVGIEDVEDLRDALATALGAAGA
jgi:cystathionine beta-lyase/cystathionine gamma-synthase